MEFEFSYLMIGIVLKVKWQGTEKVHFFSQVTGNSEI